MSNVSRKTAIKYLSAILASPVALGFSKNKQSKIDEGKIKHSLARWTFSKFTLDELATAGKEVGLDSIELLDVEDIKRVQKYGLKCAIANGSELHIPRGFNNPEYHSKLKKDYSELIPEVSETGTDKIICFSGNNDGINKEQGLENCIKGLEPLLKIAEENNVTICMELLNSKVDHKDYMCDNTEWGFKLVEKLGSQNFRLLYDIYHMQIMEGNIIATITGNHQLIAHYHTGGVPGRNEIDNTQELNYQAIIKAISSTGYVGYIGQEFIPSGSRPFDSLRKSVEICNV